MFSEDNPEGTGFVELSGISKRFGGTQALDNVSLALRAGEIHAFVGENGAGKSTLGKVIAGIYQQDGGELRVNGRPVSKWNPSRAQKDGIVMIAQELALVPDLTVEENVFLGAEEHWAGIARHNLTQRFSKLESMVGFGLDPKAKLRDLRLADQQKVEIMRSLARDARVIVMDEPTSSLTAHEMTQLHELMFRLRDRGCTIVYVSHFLDAVLEVADRVTVMRDGHHIRTSEAALETKQSLVAAMLGRELGAAFPERPAYSGDRTNPVLRVANLTTNTGVRDMSFTVGRGEIVGLLGLVGSGRSECARAIFGADEVTGGSIEFDGRLHSKQSPGQSMASQLMFVPEDRHQDGLVLQRSVRENMALARPGLFSRFGVVNVRAEKRATQALAERLQIRPPRIELPVSGFSGGNQQKALLGKALLEKPKFVILDEPTRGVDIGAKRTIYELIVELASEGIGVLMISSEHEEIMELCHRAYLVSEGRTIGEIDPAKTTVENVLFQLFHVDAKEEKAS